MFIQVGAYHLSTRHIVTVFTRRDGSVEIVTDAHQLPTCPGENCVVLHGDDAAAFLFSLRSFTTDATATYRESVAGQQRRIVPAPAQAMCEKCGEFEQVAGCAWCEGCYEEQDMAAHFAGIAARAG